MNWRSWRVLPAAVPCRAEVGKLERVQLVALLFGAGQMTHHVAEVDAVQPVRVGCNGIEFTLRQTEP